jgi:hypothetical protein
VPAPPPSMARRCEPMGDAGCRPDGKSCATPSECCAGHCLPGASGALACSSACAPDGKSCTFDGDCCAPGSACQVLRGSLVCEPQSL